MKNYIFILCLGSLLLISCWGKKNTIYEGSAEDLYQEALYELNKEDSFPWIFTGTNYDKLFEILLELQLRYPFTNYAILAELRTGDAYFKKEEYSQAIIEYTTFIQNHPGNIELEHATYQLANSHYKLLKGKDRDPLQPKATINWFTVFIEQYPNSPLTGNAREKIVECRNLLAEREIYIGNYYKNKRNYKAALERYKNVITDYPETEYREEAERLIEETQKMVSES